MEMKVTYTKDELVANEVARNALVSIINDSVNGGFMRIEGFQSKGGHGEIQNTTYCKGANYANTIKNSLKLLDAIEADADYTVTVKRGVWKDASGIANPTGRKSKVYGTSDTVVEEYKHGDAEMIEALAKIRKSLTAPERPTTDYKKLGDGVYQSDDGTLYVRDLRLVKKEVAVKGDYPFKAGKAVTALADKIKRGMPIGNYRMFRLDADYSRIALGGNELAPASVMAGATAQDKVAQVATAETVTAN
jgi:hypothetical protein